MKPWFITLIVLSLTQECVTGTGQYVNDGSGTPDMIEKAIERLKNTRR